MKINNNVLATVRVCQGFFRQKSIELQSYWATVGPRFSLVDCHSAAGSYSASLGCSVRFSCALKCSTFTRPPYESDGQEQRESSPSHSPPNIYKSEGPESRLPNCPHSGHVRIPRTMDNA
jgi:hypothetical protein